MKSIIQSGGYTDEQVDAIVATHTAISDAHHTAYTDDDASALIDTHAAISDAHHTAYTDDDASALITTHTNISDAHHAKYTDAEAVSAVSTADDYVKNDADDTMYGNFTLEGEVVINQQRDWYAFTIHGYDDQSDDAFEFNIDPDGNLWFQNSRTGSKMHFNKEIVAEQGVDLYNHTVTNPTNYADAALSGTPKLVSMVIGSTTYYFKVYPTKA